MTFPFCSAFAAPVAALLQRLILGFYDAAIVASDKQSMIIAMQTKNWKWIIFFLAVVLAIGIMVWKSQQRIKELNKQLDHSKTKQ